MWESIRRCVPGPAALPLPPRPAALRAHPACVPHAVQALPAGCPAYLGVAAACGGAPDVRLYDAGDPAGVTAWKLTRVH